jgi:RimJ/RimL family protein N-acetyltransferase
MNVCETNRLVIREFTFADAQELSEILAHPEVMKYSLRGVCSVKQTEEFVEWCIECYQSLGFGPWALVDKSSARLVGFCGVSLQAVNDVSELNLGYRLARDEWGKGLAFEAASAVLDHCKNNLGITELVVIIEPENIASLKVAHKLGFDRYEQIHFHGRDAQLYRQTL